MSKSSKPLPTLEDSFSEISQLIDQMEHKELTLEQSLTNFERGITLIKHCQKILTDAEQKVQILVKNNLQETLIPYDQNNNNEGSSTDE